MLPANDSRSCLSVHLAVFYYRASGQETSDDWWLPLHGTLLCWDHCVRHPPGTVSSKHPAGGGISYINLQIVAYCGTYGALFSLFLSDLHKMKKIVSNLRWISLISHSVNTFVCLKLAEVFFWLQQLVD